jgi:hypothetical protein
VNLQLHIEHLVLHGLAPEVTVGLSGHVQQELQRLLLQQVPARFDTPLELPRLDAGAFNVEPGATAQQVGTALAQAIYSGLCR